MLIISEKPRILNDRVLPNVYDNMSEEEKDKLLKAKRQRYAKKDKENQLNAKKHVYDVS